MERALEKYIDQERLYRNEGRQGVINTCKIVRAIGYKDPYMSGQMAPGACTGDLLLFLEDNPGALEAIGNWIAEQNVPEWKANLEALLEPEEDEAEQLT